MMRRIPSAVWTTGKAVIAAGLIGWLITTDKLDFSALEKLWQNPRILAATICFWGLGAVVICAFRWRALVLGMNYQLSAFEAVRLNLIGLFFNTVMPGVVGGDLIKAIYVCQGQEKSTKVPVLLTILLDRIIGLVALFAISLITIIANWQAVMAQEMLRPFVALIIGIMAGLFAFGLFVGLPTRFKENTTPIRWLYRGLFRLALLKRIYLALRSYKNQPWHLIQAMAFALLHQLAFMCLFLIVTNSFHPEPLPVGLLATILPLGMVTTALPLAPGGMGVGHLAFEKLFTVIGFSDGANIFNVIFFGLLFLNLLGCVPYLFLQRELSPLLKPQSNLRGANSL